MRKLFPLLVVGILVLSGLGAIAGTEKNEENILSEKIVFSQPIFSNDGNYVSLELAEANVVSWEKDKPALPIVTKTYTFPFGTKIDDVQVVFSEINQKVISKPISPSPEALMLTEALSNNNVKSEEILTYSDITVYPEERFGYRIGAGLKDEEHVIYLSVSLFPDQYFPNQNMICHANEATINVKYTLPEIPVTFGDTYDFLIIAPASFESALQPLVDHKNNLDPPIRTNLVTLDEIPSGVGVDTQEDIKYFIKDAIEDWGITYVLLVGAGVEDEEIFPVRQAWVGSAPYEDYFPSDLYFADIYDGTGGFSDWDVDGDGKFAEYPTDIAEIDVLPDVYLGKWPANDASEVTTLVNKVIDYKAHNKMTNKIVQAGGDSFTGDAIYEGEYANRKVMEKLPGYTTTRLWASYPNPDYTTKELTKANIKEGYMSGVDFVDFSGHGSWASWATHPPNDEDTWVPPPTLISNYNGFFYFEFELFMINNGKKLPVVMYNSCSNNKYSASPDCLGWRTLTKNNGGGIAAYAASGIGYGSQGNHETERVMGWMEVHTFQELVSNKILGQVWGNCVTDYYNSFSSDMDISDWKTVLEFSMFGDPTVVVENGDNPTSTPVNIPVFERLVNSFPLIARFINIMLARLN